MFLETPANIDIAGYADDNTPYTYSSNIVNHFQNKSLGSKCRKTPPFKKL